MEQKEVLEQMRQGIPVFGGSPAHQAMHDLAQEALRLTMELNGRYHTPEEIRKLFSQIIGKPVDGSFRMFPPFHTDCGKNIAVGRRVFINAGCCFQDQGASPSGTAVSLDTRWCWPPSTTVFRRENGRQLSGSHHHRQSRLDWVQGRRPSRRLHWRRGDHSRGRGGYPGCAAQCDSGRRPCPDHQTY